MDVTNTAGTLTIGNITLNGAPLPNNLLAEVEYLPHVVLSGGGHTIAVDQGTTIGTGTVTVDGAAYNYTTSSATGSSLTFSLASAAPSAGSTGDGSTTS
jgi:hypothetical protein